MSAAVHFHGLTKVEAKTTYHGSDPHKFCCLDLVLTDKDGYELLITTFARAENHPALARVAQAINEVGFGGEEPKAFVAP